MARAMTKEEFQKKIDEKYGEGEWTVEEYKGSRLPLVILHKCGKEKRLTRASTFSSGGRDHCEECKALEVGRPKLTFEELSERITDATYGTYELVELVDSTNFTVNHKSCNRPPFKTSVTRFFTRGQRCQCSKKGIVGRKPDSEVACYE
ncbi:hypothetical protein PN290_00250 [Romboutsia sp. 1001216sp1]|uniref:hypothetical protein n=1 Tax=unclassified Romboutsia TaxID=2626894 RepID=UPI0018AB8A70|nr:MULTISPECIES: hypothetical protein [unclassified Romboutsia]MDB8794286.1 hypothetical protein [Romboutsia sp. 1001216sp1]MDB8796455.1 hypothetical protein [Romboutsia sp. 1001216sp1]MDB8797792.1 hypothetical protein [Romboutsia sp. 1001216sp1]